jgi:hypothetical protein
MAGLIEKAMKPWRSEGRRMTHRPISSESGAQRVEHYEFAACTTAPRLDDRVSRRDNIGYGALLVSLLKPAARVHDKPFQATREMPGQYPARKSTVLSRVHTSAHQEMRYDQARMGTGRSEEKRVTPLARSFSYCEMRVLFWHWGAAS